MKAVANESFGYNEDEIVSSDIVGMRFGSLFVIMKKGPALQAGPFHIN